MFFGEVGGVSVLHMEIILSFLINVPLILLFFLGKTCRYCTQVYFRSGLQSLFFFFLLSLNKLWQVVSLRHPAMQATQTENHHQRTQRRREFSQSPQQPCSPLEQGRKNTWLSLCQKHPCDTAPHPRLWWQTENSDLNHKIPKTF